MEQPKFTPGQTLYYLKDGQYLPCEYLRHFRGEVYIVKPLQGEYQGHQWKDENELFTEIPTANDQA